ncbi:MAG: AAA family ATPase [Nitriliruptorales bacterium]
MTDALSTGGLAVALPPLSPLTLQMRRVTGSVVGRFVELAAIRQELASVKRGQLSALTLEGEPGIGKSRLLVTTYELAVGDGFLPIAVTADEELRGPFLLARAVFAGAAAQDVPDFVRAQLQRALDAIFGRDEPGLETLSADYKLLRAFDLAALALRALAGHKPVALLVDDLQWADEDSVRMLRYILRSAADLPIFLVLALRPDELALVTEATNLIADMERMGMVRRLKLGRFTQMETAELLRQVLGGEVDPVSAATVHAQAEGVPFIVEELTRTYRDAGLVQQIDGVWMLARNAERLVPSAVRTLIQRRAARLPEPTRLVLAEAAILGRNFSLKDLSAVRLHLAEDEGGTPTALAEALAPAVEAGLLVELPEGSVADYRFTHEQVKEFAAETLTTARRRTIHAAVVDMLTAGGDPPPASLPLVAHHAVSARDSERAARFSVDAARAALASHAPDEVLRLVDVALPTTSAARDRVALLSARDDALGLLHKSTERLEGLAELTALAEALEDSQLELEIKLRRAAALRFSGEDQQAVELAQQVRRLAQERGDRRGELAASLELGQALLRSPLGEAFSVTASEVDLDGAEEAYRHAAELADELGDLAALAAVTRELGVIEIGRARAWIVDLIKRGEHLPIMRRIAAGENPDDVLPEYPVAPFVMRATSHYERALELFERLGDRRGVMSTIIAIAFANFGVDIHFQGSAKRIEEIRRLSAQMHSLTRESERGRAEGQMLYGAHVFARAKVVPDLALSHGERAHDAARSLGDRLLEFASAGGTALGYLDVGEVEEAERWLDRAAAAATAAPTPLRARQLELWRGTARAAAGDAVGMRQHLERAVRLATDQGRPAARCEALARLALEASRLGAERQDEELLSLAEHSARDAKALVPLLPGHPLWGAQADAALAGVALARGAGEEAAEAGRSALSTLRAVVREDLNLEIVLPAARAVLAAGQDAEKQMLREELRLNLALIAQRTLDENIRVRWLKGPLGHELCELAGPLEDEKARSADGTGESPADEAVGQGAELAEDETHLLWLLIEGRTNREIALELGVSEEVVARRLAEIYAKMGTSSRAEATAFAFNFNVV